MTPPRWLRLLNGFAWGWLSVWLLLAFWFGLRGLPDWLS